MSAAVASADAAPGPRPMLRRLLAALVVCPVLYVVAGERLRQFEADVLFTVAGAVLPGIRASGTGAIVTHDGAPLAVLFSTSCSIALVLSALATFALLIVRAPWGLRVLGFLGAAAVAFGVNLVRVVLLLVAATYLGPGAMMWLHELAGPVVTLVAGIASLLVLMRIVTGKPGTRDSYDPAAPNSTDESADRP